MGKLYMAVELGTTKADMAFEINKLRGKLQRADKKIKECIKSFNELHEFIQIMQDEGNEMCIYKGLIDERFEHQKTHTEVVKLRKANADLKARFDAVREQDPPRGVYTHKTLYEEGQKIRRGLEATIVEKDKSIGELVDRVNDECEKNKANIESLNYLSSHMQDYAAKLLKNDATIIEKDKTIGGLEAVVFNAKSDANALLDVITKLRRENKHLSKHSLECAVNSLENDATISGLADRVNLEHIIVSELRSELTKANDIIRNLRDKYEPKYVRCVYAKQCDDVRCVHFHAHTKERCDEYMDVGRCPNPRCVPWIGDV